MASFRLPPYSPEEPDLWLLQVQCAFDVSGVDSDELRFKLLVANLPANIAVQVKDVIRSSRSFDVLCAALQARLAQSRADRLQALLGRQQLCDQKPTALLRSMRNELAAAGDAPVDTELFRTLFQQRLPQPVRAALALLPADSTLDALAEAADRYLEASGPDPRLSAIAAQPYTQPAPPIAAAVTAPARAATPALDTVIASLVAKMERLEASNRRLEDAVRRDRSRSRPRQASRQSSPPVTGSSFNAAARRHAVLVPPAIRRPSAPMQVAVLLDRLGKLRRPVLMAQSTGAPHAAPLLFVRDTETDRQFLVDTGAQVSVLPRRCLPNGSTLTPAPVGQQLVAANGSPIAVHGTCLLDVTLSQQHRLKHRFFVTDVTTPILGTDFLAAHHLVVDVANQRLLRDGTVCASAERSRLCSIGVREVRKAPVAMRSAVF
ncbi:hypothetical protein FJT64_010221 [Amphibalanus amphitrite]|uniref:Peptidase A2 domain-containing protein n=1 Tax=Amphibalanus amphitrite TaxID=1232801 RepID=A0A6A4VCX2_AMPAM|nr:hypothetical protein FJT64_010221 [Amphibalanus amphitrite]